MVKVANGSVPAVPDSTKTVRFVICHSTKTVNLLYVIHENGGWFCYPHFFQVEFMVYPLIMFTNWMHKCGLKKMNCYIICIEAAACWEGFVVWLMLLGILRWPYLQGGCITEVTVQGGSTVFWTLHCDRWQCDNVIVKWRVTVPGSHDAMFGRQSHHAGVVQEVHSCLPHCPWEGETPVDVYSSQFSTYI